MSVADRQGELLGAIGAFEGTDVEFKSAKGGLPASLWETYSAFANTDGGTIYLGVAQRGETLDVHGLDAAERVLKTFWDTVNNRSKVSRNLLLNSDVELLPLPDSARNVIAIHVPRAGRRERPVYVGIDPFAGTFRRSEEGDYRCSEAQIRRMFADHSDEPADSRILEGFSLHDVDPDSLRQYRNRFMSRAPGHSWLAKDDIGLLEQLGGWRRERKSGREGLTVAGLLMFGRTQAIQAAEAVPGFHVDYRERLANDPQVRWSDRLTVDGTWEANLFQFYQRVMQRFAADAGLKRPFAQDAEGVRALVTPVHDALQEALVNALVHADHSGVGGIVVERYQDRFEFSNPGTLLVSLEQILRGGVSECRNPALQRMFQMLGAGDKAGSGMDKIRSSWKAQHWQSPRLEETQRPDRVHLSLPTVSMLPERVLAELQARFGERFSGLGTDAVQVLVTAVTEGSVSNQRLQEILTLHRRDITTLLQTLVRDAYLVANGLGRGTRYALTAGRAHSSSPDFGQNPPDLAASSPDFGQNPPDLAASPPDLPVSTPDLTVHATADTGGHPEAAERLQAIARDIRESGKARRELVRGAILALCAGRYLSLRDLSELLGRRQESLRDGYVSKMVREGELELLFPKVPSHREQAYRTTAKGSAEAST